MTQHELAIPGATSRHRTLLAELKKLDDRDLETLYSAVLTERWREEAVAKWGEITSACLCRLWAKRCHGDCQKLAAYTLLDHPVAHRKHGCVTAIVGHPYNHVLSDWKSLNEATDFCARHGLQFTVDLRSWYCPGKSVAVIFTRQEEQASR